jgi:hypothetical protein
VFDHEILLAFARNRILEADSPLWKREWCEQLNFMVPYFLHQRRDDDDSSGTDIISLMNHLVDRLARHSPKGTERDELRYQYMKRLLAYAQHNPLRRVVRAVEDDPIDFDPSYELLVAAAYIGDLELVDELSQDTRRIGEDIRSELFFDRLIEAAVKSLDPKIVEMLLARGAKLHEEWSDDQDYSSPVVLVPAEHWNPKMLQLLLQPEFGLMTSGLAYQRAIVEAMRVNRAEALAMLLDHYTAPLSESRYLLREGLEEACRSGLVDIVRLLLDNGADVNETGTTDSRYRWPRPLANASWKGQVGVMRLLLARGASIGEHGDDAGGEAMRAVAWGGHYDAMEVLLDAGLLLDTRSWTDVMVILSFQPNGGKLARRILDDGHLRLSDLQVDGDDEGYIMARFMHVRLSGLQVPDDDNSYALAKLVSVACAHGNFEFLKVLFDHGAPMNDDAIYSQWQYPAPIVIAMCYRQDALVEALRKLGAHEVDPLQSIIGYRFKEGYFPRNTRPPPTPDNFFLRPAEFCCCMKMVCIKVL